MPGRTYIGRKVIHKYAAIRVITATKESTGVFRDEDGEYPAGSWLRNPRLSRHTPHTGAEGALIYVKVGAGSTLTVKLGLRGCKP